MAEEKSPESDQLLEAGESENGSDKKNNGGGNGGGGVAERGPTGVTRTLNIAKTVWVSSYGHSVVDKINLGLVA